MFVNRNPFAREELHSSRVYTGFHTCKWCGQVKTTPNGRKYLYQYRVEADGGQKYNIDGLFCSVGCMRAYHG